MKLVKKIKIKINQDCKDYLEFASEQCRLCYNFTLNKRIDYYQKYQKSISIYELKKEFNNKTKKEYLDYNKVYNKCLTNMFFRLEKAYQNFFRRVKNKENPGFPKYKRKNQFISQEYPAEYIKIIDDYKFIIPTGKTYGKNFIIRTTEKIPNSFSTIIIQKNKNHYFVCFIIEQKEKSFIDNKGIIAIDLGIKTLCTGITNEFQRVIIKKFSYYTNHLKTIQSRRDKCKKYSNRWKKFNKLYWKQLNKYRNRVNDYLHKSSYWLCASPDLEKQSTIVVGELNLKGMKTNQSWFNKILFNECRISRFVELLNYKSKLYGKQLIKIDESYTTKTCSRCGNIQNISLKDRIFICKTCGFEIDRDNNSAINIFEKYINSVADTIDNKIINEFKKLKNLNINNTDVKKINTFVYV